MIYAILSNAGFLLSATTVLLIKEESISESPLVNEESCEPSFVKLQLFIALFWPRRRRKSLGQDERFDVEVWLTM